MKRFWVSWYATRATFNEFELHNPWWITGERLSDEAITVCAAVQADDEEAAKEVIYAAYDNRPETLEFRFVEERSRDWRPYGGRFPQAAWMEWPTQ